MNNKIESADHASSKSRIFGLDILRSLAILLVLISHFYMHSDYAVQFPWLNSFGYFGVEIFFALSGFLIGSIILKMDCTHPKNFLKVFWVKRWMRTLPNYYVILSLELWRQAVHPYYAKKYFFFLQGVSSAPDDFYGVSWSLAVEEWFYLLLPLAILLIYRMKANMILSLTLMLIAYTILKYFYAFFNHDLYSQLPRMTFFRIDAILYGVLLSAVVIYFPKMIERWKYSLFLIAIAGFIALNFIIPVQSDFFVLSAKLSLNSLFFTMLIPFALSMRTNIKFFANSCRVFSEASYSMYLLHIPMLALYKYFLLPQLQYNVVGFVVFISTVTMISIFWFYVFEKPIMKLREYFI
ncbi:MAG: acyltransferase [Planctomycetes bacterium]|nr:acyltransferase [Planctomycetota bacterium]